MQYSMTFCSRPEAASDVISGMHVSQIVPNKIVKFVGRGLNFFREIRLQVVGDGIINGFFCYNFKQKVASSAVVVKVGVDFCVEFVDSRSNHFGVVRPAHFVMDNDDRMTTNDGAHGNS